jgi:hypothetical protein
MTHTHLSHFEPLVIAAPYWAIGLLSFPRHRRTDALMDTLPEAEKLVRDAFDELKRHRSDDGLCLAARTVIDACPSPSIVESPSLRVLAALTTTVPTWRERLPALSLAEHLPWPRRWLHTSASERLTEIADEFTRLTTPPAGIRP